MLENPYGERLFEGMRRGHDGAIEAAQVIEKLVAMARDFEAMEDLDAAFGPSPDEIAFDDTLANNAGTMRELSDATLRRNAVVVDGKPRTSMPLDRQLRESVKAKPCNPVRRTP